MTTTEDSDICVPCGYIYSCGDYLALPHHLTMWRVLFLVVTWGCLGALAETGVMGRLSWCKTLCICETETNREVQCFQEDEIYQLLNFSARSVKRLRRTNWTLEGNVDWCSELCLCNTETSKEFKCTEPGQLTQLILDRIGNTYFLELEENSYIKREEERSVDEVEEEQAELDQEVGHRKRSERKKNRKNKKPRKNQKHRHPSEEEPQQEPDSEPEAEPEPTYADVQLPALPTHTPTDNYEYVVDEVEVIEQLPKQEAVAASPAVTALQPPTRQGQILSTAESYTPRASSREVEGLSPRIQPVVEVPKEKKTVASMVSQDLDDLGSTVRNIKNDVMLNQRILLVTVAIAGVAMLG